MSLPLRLLILICVGSAACADPVEPTTGPPGVHVITGDGAADTISAVVQLVAEVRDSSGAARSGATTRFFLAYPTVGAELLASRDGHGADNLTVHANRLGRASAWVRFTGSTGVVSIIVRADGLAPDTAHLSVLPGRPARVRWEGGSVTVFANTSWTPKSFVVFDRHGNLLSDLAVAIAGGTRVASVSPTGDVTMGEAGRGYVVGSLGALRDSAWVSVVPPGSVAFLRSPGKAATWWSVQVSPLVGGGGSVAAQDYALIGGSLDWSPDGQELLAGRAITTPGGGLRELPRPAGVTAIGAARFSADGQWLYFSARTEEAPEVLSLWRMRPDGSAAERLVGAADRSYDMPAPAPDQSSLAAVSWQVGTGADTTKRLVRVSLGDRSITAYNQPGIWPRFTPNGTEIVYLRRGTPEHDLVAIPAAGGTPRSILDGRVLRGTFGLTADGAFAAVILATTEEPRVRMHLVRLADGELLPLPFSRDLYTTISGTAVKP